MKPAANTKASKPSAAPKRQLRPVSLVGGLVLGSVAGGAAWVDITNNHAFGSSISPQLGTIMALGAIALTVLPAMKPLLAGNSSALRVVRLGIWVGGLMTVVAALSAHLDKQAADRIARQTANDAYAARQVAVATAQRDYDAATAEVGAITETSPSEQLLKLADGRDADAKKEAGNQFCGKLCQGYQREANAFRERAGRAKAREDALARAEDAKQRLKQADSQQIKPAEVAPLAAAFAAQAGVTTASAVHDVELFIAVLSILATVSLALLSEPGAELVRRGLGLDHEPAPQSAPKSKARPIIVRAEPEKRGRPRISRDERIAQFIAECVKPGAGEVRGAEIYALFSTWWETTCPGYGVPDAKRLSKGLKDAGVARFRRKTGTVYAAALLQ